jgi:hypothetical protein
MIMTKMTFDLLNIDGHFPVRFAGALKASNSLYIYQGSSWPLAGETRPFFAG